MRGFNKYGVKRVRRDRYNTTTNGSNKRNHWWELSAKVRKRDNNTCLWCKKPANEVHHIIPLSRGGSNTMANMACICGSCHDRRPYHQHMAGRSVSKFVEPF